MVGLGTAEIYVLQLETTRWLVHLSFYSFLFGLRYKHSNALLRRPARILTSPQGMGVFASLRVTSQLAKRSSRKECFGRSKRYSSVVCLMPCHSLFARRALAKRLGQLGGREARTRIHHPVQHPAPLRCSICPKAKPITYIWSLLRSLELPGCFFASLQSF
jgi:hypothetical protein